MKTPIEEILQNLINELESELRVFEQVNNEYKDNMFYVDYSNVSYVAYLNTVARVKEVLFRMSINKGKSK